MEKKVHLIPFDVNERIEVITEIPKGVKLIGAPRVWDKTKGKGIKIAVLDTGCDVDHPDLKDRIVGGRNFTGDDRGNPNIYNDYNGHGTHVAGTIAATENDEGVMGVAPQADLLIVKVLDENGSGQYKWIIDGINYAVQQRVDIISMSLGGSEDVFELYEAISEAIEQGVLVVCAAGNEGDGRETSDEYAYPGAYNEVISVGAVNLERQSSPFSNSHNQIDLVAPGEHILSTYLNGTFAKLSGTSMATPHVAGALALIKNIATNYFERNLSETELYAQLIKRTVPLGNSPKLEGNGFLYLAVEDHLAHVFSKRISASVFGLSTTPERN